MSATTQNALLLTEKHGDFAIKTLPISKPGPGELLVKIQAVALNPVDWKIQKYNIGVKTYPAVLGTDIAGDVVEVGEGVTKISVGDRVLFQGIYTNEKAGFQQYTIATHDTVAKIPESISYEEAATVPVGLTAAYIGLYQLAPDGLGLASPLDSWSTGPNARGKPLVVIGGSSSVGQYVIQLAKFSGFSSIITTSSLKHEAYLKSLGATHVIDRNKPLAEEVREITSALVQYVYDTISSDATQKAGYDLLASGGQLAVLLPPSVENVDEKAVAPVMGTLAIPHNREVLVKLYAKLYDLLEEGVLKPNRVEVVPGGLGGIVEGLQKLQNDQVSGVKLVAHPQDIA